MLHLPDSNADLAQAPVVAEPACTVMLDNGSLDVAGIAREVPKSRRSRHNPLASLGIVANDRNIRNAWCGCCDMPESAEEYRPERACCMSVLLPTLGPSRREVGARAEEKKHTSSLYE